MGLARVSGCGRPYFARGIIPACAGSSTASPGAGPSAPAKERSAGRGGVVVALGVCVPAAASVYLPDRVGVGSGGPPDSTPASTPAVAAQTEAAGGGELGVATYRNADGRRCAAFGHVGADGRLVDRTGAEVPFHDGGDCTMRRAPVAVHVGSQSNDPTTPGNDRSLIVWGLAADDVEEIEIAVGDERRVTRPGRDGAFIVSTPPTHGEVVLTLRRSAGNQHKLTLTPAPNLDELNRRLKNGEIPRHEPGGP